LFGGSFNPAHSGHLYVALTALRRLKLDYVWWLVSPGNPLKNASSAGDFAKRFASAQKIARHPRLIVSDLERQLGTRYTLDTVKTLLHRFPQVQFVWLMGSDNLEQFARWRRWQEIARLVPIAVVRRPGSVLAPLHAPLARRLGVSRRAGRAPSLVILDGRRNWASSTALRAEALGAMAEAMVNLTP
jgi:nicotinate-nucleotide adenylyltransferase